MGNSLILGRRAAPAGQRKVASGLAFTLICAGCFLKMTQGLAQLPATLESPDDRPTAVAVPSEVVVPTANRPDEFSLPTATAPVQQAAGGGAAPAAAISASSSRPAALEPLGAVPVLKVKILTRPVQNTGALSAAAEVHQVKKVNSKSDVSDKKDRDGVHIAQATAAVPLPPLRDGQYGFAAPQRFAGVPAAFVTLGSRFPTYGIIVEKWHHRLTVFQQKAENQYDIVKTYRAITGKDPGDKVHKGDLRTPEGIYFITGRLSDAQLPSKYGRLALTLDYPNIYDRRQRKSGSGIWIHATDDPNRLLKPFDTEGCVAVSNEDVLDLSKYITPFETPVVITKEMAGTVAEELARPRELALKMIEGWRNSWEKSDFENYMKFYSAQFKTLGRDVRQWEGFKKRLSEQRNTSIKVEISQPKILAFEDQLLAVFEQKYESSQHSDHGKKFLYLQWEGDQYRIIAEKWYKL